VRVHVVDLARVDGRIVQGDRGGPAGLATIGSWLDHVMRIGRRPVAEDLGIGRGASTFRRFGLLEDQQRRSFAHDEAVPLRVEGPCRVPRVVVVPGPERPDDVERPERER